MSWDVMIFNIRGKDAQSLEQIQETDYEPLGPAAVVRQQISSLLPGIDWSDTTWGNFYVDGLSIEFNVGEDDPITNMMLHIRGGGDAIAAIVAFARPLGWSALDCSTGEFLNLDHPSQEGWEGFQAYRDKVTDTCRQEESS